MPVTRNLSEDPNIRVSPNAGVIDAVQAALRYAGFLVTAVVAVVGLIKTRDIAGLSDYLQTNGGQIVAAISGLVAFGISAYGVYKTHKRGSQVADVALDDRVPSEVADVK